MDSMQTIKNRITRIGSTKQITQAMHLVSSTKVQRARRRMERARPYYEASRQLMEGIAKSMQKTSRSPFLLPAQEGNAAVIVISSDQGLCGGYNINVAKAAAEVIKKTGSKHVVAVGKKARDYLQRRNQPVLHCFEAVTQTPYFEEAQEIAQIAIDLFNNKKINEVYLVYTRFFTMLQFEPIAVRLLPLDLSEQADQADTIQPIPMQLLEPEEDAFLNMAVPQYLSAYIYGATVEASVCEQCSRILSMEEAVTNSTELIDKLTQQYNRARQGAITQELSEIVGGYNAL